MAKCFPFVVYKGLLQSIILTVKSEIIQILILKVQKPKLPELRDHSRSNVSKWRVKALRPVLGLLAPRDTGKCPTGQTVSF